jgi:hypothetical protein
LTARDNSSPEQQKQLLIEFCRLYEIGKKGGYIRWIRQHWFASSQVFWRSLCSLSWYTAESTRRSNLSFVPCLDLVGGWLAGGRHPASDPPRARYEERVVLTQTLKPIVFVSCMYGLKPVHTQPAACDGTSLRHRSSVVFAVELAGNFGFLCRDFQELRKAIPYTRGSLRIRCTCSHRLPFRSRSPPKIGRCR